MGEHDEFSKRGRETNRRLLVINRKACLLPWAFIRVEGVARPVRRFTRERDGRGGANLGGGGGNRLLIIAHSVPDLTP